MTYCFKFILRDVALILSPVGDFFRPVYGIGVRSPSCGIWITTDL